MSEMTRDAALALLTERAADLRLLVDGRPTRMAELHEAGDGVQVLVNLDGRGVIVRNRTTGWSEKFTWKEIEKGLERARQVAYARKAYAEFKRGAA